MQGTGLWLVPADRSEAFEIGVLQQAHNGCGGRQLQGVRPLPVGQRGGAAVLIHERQCNARDSCGGQPETTSVSPALGTPLQVPVCSLPPRTWDCCVTIWVAQCHVAGRARGRGCSQGSRG